jgi:hypothetical protein
MLPRNILHWTKHGFFASSARSPLPWAISSPTSAPSTRSTQGTGGGAATQEKEPGLQQNKELHQVERRKIKDVNSINGSREK